MRTDRTVKLGLAGVLATVAAGGLALMGCGGDDGGGCAKGTVCTWAGTGEQVRGLDHLDRRATAMYWPMDLEFAPDGRAYVLDWNNHLVRRVNADGKFEIVIGTDNVGDGPDDPDAERTPPGVPGTTVNLNHPTDVTFTADGTLILAAWHNHKIRQLDVATGMVDVTCGNGPGFAGDGGPAAMALMNQPKAVAVAANGDIFVVDTRNVRVRRIAAADPFTIETVAGSGTRGYGGDGGPPLEAQFAFQPVEDNPEPGGGLAIDGQGRLYVADTQNHRIRRIDLAANLITTVAGDGAPGFSGDGGLAVDAQLKYPRDVELGPDGRLYIADTENHRVRAVDMETGLIATVAGDGVDRFGGDGGDPLRASFNRPWGIAFDGAGNLYVADTLNNRVREIMH
jgi:DNA-binding beta-propeller fold protein YncE